MKNKILVINGASRINGNTDIVINKIIEGAHDAGVNIKLVEFYHLLFKRLNIKIVDMIFFSGIFKKRAVLDQGEYLNQAYLLGKNL